MSKAVILIIEDDPDIRELLSAAFAPEGWKLLMAESGEEGLTLLKANTVDCILLDIMLPGMDGLKTLKKIRADIRSKIVPVILATAKGEETDIIAGLELGADDYVVKPYSLKVLTARIRSALRRMEETWELSPETPVQQGSLKADPMRYEAFDGDRRLDLSATEFALLRHFLTYPDIVFSRNRLIAAIHGEDYPATDRSVDVQILALRKKLGDSGALIETIRGVGYRFSLSGTQ
ncbi:MAG: response regulator transcription factor [Spirochaetaceae bacterium]|jgi:two-component system phosphate regulon response regulator PhoB|nr:response regulator transcription factor [Spirochaetaceae bacterium]